MKNSFFLFIIHPFLLSSCNNEDELLLETTVLQGTWIEQEPYSDGICDTIIFREDYKIGLYIPLIGWDYKLIIE